MLKMDFAAIRWRALGGLAIAAGLALAGLLGCGAGGSSSSIGGGGGGGAAVVAGVSGVIAGCSTTNPGSPIGLSRVQSRVTGVAPLAVFFDATGTTHTTPTVTTFSDLEYQWDFGDTNQALAPGGLVWATGSRAGTSERNKASGPVAAHVYETPGTYVVSVTVVDGTPANTVSNNCVQIVVTDPDVVFARTDTICVSSTGLPTAGINGCPADALTDNLTNFKTIIDTYGQPGKRVLLQRGDTFTTSAPAVIAAGIAGAAGPGILGAFGTGARPIIQATAGIAILRPSTFNTPGRADWRVMDLELDGNGNANAIAIHPDGAIDQLTILRVFAHGVTNAFFFNAFDLDGANPGNPGHTLWDQLAIVDCQSTNITGFASALSIYASAQRFMLLGNNLNNNGGGEHTVRLPSAVRAVISNNLLQGQSPAKHAFTLRAAVHGSGGVEGGRDTQFVVVSDNKFLGTTGSDQTTMYGPQGFVDERVADTITERNWYVAGGGAGGTQVGLQLVAHREQTIRNNLFETSGGKAHGGINIQAFGALIVPDKIRVFHNSFFSSDADNDFLAVSNATTTITNVTIRNNLARSQFDTQHFMVDCAGSPLLAACAGVTASNNSSNAQVSGTPSGFTEPPVSTLDWKPTAGYAIGGGAVVPVWSDFFRTARPAGAPDLGAVTH